MRRNKLLENEYKVDLHGLDAAQAVNALHDTLAKFSGEHSAGPAPLAMVRVGYGMQPCAQHASQVLRRAQCGPVPAGCPAWPAVLHGPAVVQPSARHRVRAGAAGHRTRPGRAPRALACSGASTRVRAAGRAGTMRLVFITGQGLHSASGRAVVRPALLAAVARLGLECEASAGAVTVLLRPEAGR